MLVLANTTIKHDGVLEGCRYGVADVDVLLFQLRCAGYGGGRAKRTSKVSDAHWYVMWETNCITGTNNRQVLSVTWLSCTNNLISFRQ